MPYSFSLHLLTRDTFSYTWWMQYDEHLPGLSFLRMNTMHNNNSLFSSSSNGTNAICLFPASTDILCKFVADIAEFLEGAGEARPPFGLATCWRVESRLSSMNGRSRLLWNRRACSRIVVKNGMYNAAILACFS